MVYVLLAEGFEELEAVEPIDVLRRCGIEVKTIGVSGEYVTGSNGITIKVDMTLSELDTANAFETNHKKRMLILPGGPGRTNILKNEKAMNFVRICCETEGVLIAAICGAPEILGETGVLTGSKYTCYPGLQSGISCGEFVDKPVVIDNNFTTAQGAGTSKEFAFAIAEQLVGKEKADEIYTRMCYR
ncbi:MAG: DJ-1/PfpI family protein [Oscillospiraceae bacterium]|nr:DJ-1/PfpI family protein [Oscillospiraceae bacterium]